MFAAEVSGDEVALLGLHDAGRVTLRERGILVQELVLQNGRVGRRDVAGEVVLARTDFLGGTIREADDRGGVAGNLHVPLDMLQGLFPVADNRAIGRQVADVGKRAVLDAEVGLEDKALIGNGRTAAHSSAGGESPSFSVKAECGVARRGIGEVDAAQILVAPGNQVAQQHDVVAAVHLRTGLVAVPELPNGRRTILGHIAPGGIAVLGGNHIGDVAETVVREAAQQPGDANDSAGHVGIVLDDDVLNDILRHLLAVLLGNDAERQCQQVGGGGVVAVEDGVGVQRMPRPR